MYKISASENESCDNSTTSPATNGSQVCLCKLFYCLTRLSFQQKTIHLLILKFLSITSFSSSHHYMYVLKLHGVFLPRW